MKLLTQLAFFSVVMTLSLMLAGCPEKGPAEKAGEAIDETVEKTKDAAREAKE